MIASDSHSCITHGLPAAVHENGSWRGMPDSKMSRPVRRCHQKSLSTPRAKGSAASTANSMPICTQATGTLIASHAIDGLR